MFDNLPASLPHDQSGKLRALRCRGAQRASPSLPDSPRSQKRDIERWRRSIPWFGVFGPAGAYRRSTAKPNQAFVDALAMPS